MDTRLSFLLQIEIIPSKICGREFVDVVSFHNKKLDDILLFRKYFSAFYVLRLGISEEVERIISGFGNLL